MRMLRVLSLLLPLLIAWPAVSHAETMEHKLIHDGKERTYLLTVPSAPAANKLPLVVALHFYPGSGRALAGLTGFSEVAEREGFLVAYPDGLNGGFNAIMCCGGADDVGFIRTLIEDIAATHNIDRDRVYATGISNGGDLVYRLAAELPGVFAAIAPVSGGMNDAWIEKPEGNLPKQPTSLIAFHGKRDRFHDAFAAGTAFWLQEFGCTTKSAVLANTNVEVAHGPCPKGSNATVYTLPDMGHAWPGGRSGMAYTPSPIDATELIWKFFRDSPRRSP